MAQDTGIVSPNLLAQVRTLLKNNPRGMSVTDIAAGLGMNRNSAAKYLDILCVGGQIEMRAFGPAKVYFLSQHVPLGAILNYTSEYILVLDQQYRILQVNDRFLEFLRVAREDLLGKGIDQVRLPIVSAPQVRSRLIEARSEGEVSLELETGDGESRRYYRVRLISTVFDDASTGLTCIIEEITDRKRAEQDLKERERRFREIVELSPFPSAIVDPGGRFLYVNIRFAETFGYTADECGTIGNWFGLAHPDLEYEKLMTEAWQGALAADSNPEPRLLHVRTRNGDLREVVFHQRRLSDGNLYLVYEDISELRRLEDALAERRRIDDTLYRSLRRFTEISEAGRNLLFSASPDGRLNYVSPLFERLAGRRAAELVGRPLTELLSSPEPGFDEGIYIEIAGGRSIESRELAVLRPDGQESCFIATLSPSRSGSGSITGLDCILLLRSDRCG